MAAANSRKRNFTTSESNLLVAMGREHLEMLNSRQTNLVTNKYKEDLWKVITAEINKINGFSDREWKDVRKKFADICSSTKKKERMTGKERRKTGGGIASSVRLNAAEQLLADVIPRAAVSGISSGTDTMGNLVSAPARTPGHSFLDLLADNEDLASTISEEYSDSVVTDDLLSTIDLTDTVSPAVLPSVSSSCKPNRRRQIDQVLEANTKIYQALKELATDNKELLIIKRLKYKAQGFV